MILDEVQTGFGRTGKNFACENWDVTPDIMCLAKPFAGGLPIGITVAREDLMSAFKTGEHTTTFSGSPMVCAVGCAAIDALVEEKLADKAAANGQIPQDATGRISPETQEHKGSPRLRLNAWHGTPI